MTKYTYPSVGEFPGHTAELIDWEETERLAPEIIRLTGRAYAAAVKQGHCTSVDTTGAPLSAGSILKHYDPKSTAVHARFIERSRDIHERGGRITVVRDHENSDKLLAYSKIGPAPAMTEREGGHHGTYDYLGHYINNLIVDPDHKGQGLGSVVLHAGLVLNDVHRDDPLVLDAMHGNWAANNWYRRLGFRPDPSTPTCEMTFGDQHVPQEYYVTTSSLEVFAHLYGTHRFADGKDYNDALQRGYYDSHVLPPAPEAPGDSATPPPTGS